MEALRVHCIAVFLLVNFKRVLTEFKEKIMIRVYYVTQYTQHT